LPFDDGISGGALFSAAYPTSVPGEYNFLVRAEALNEDCDMVQREISRTIRVRPEPDPQATEITVDPGPSETVITVTPRARLGHFIGPGHADDFVIEASGAAQSGPVDDKLDGSYGIPFMSSGTGDARVFIRFQRTSLPPVSIANDQPIAEVVVPGGAPNDAPTNVAIILNDPDTADEVTGVLLEGGGDSIPLEFSVELATGNVNAVVPAKLPPGVYHVVLLCGDDRSPTTASAVFQVLPGSGGFSGVADGFSSGVDGLVTAGSSGPVAVALGGLLVQLRDAPLGPTLTQERKTVAVEEVSRLLANGVGPVGEGDIPNLLEARERIRIDSRNIEPGPVNTPAGQEIQVELAHNLRVAFNRVTTGGESIARIMTEPDGFEGKLGHVPTVFDISTTAGFDPKDQVTVEIAYQDGDFVDESKVILAHEKDGYWMDITRFRDENSNVVRGMTDSFSRFALVEVAETEPGNLKLEREGDAVEISTPEGEFYFLEHSRDLSPGSWETISPAVSGAYPDRDPERVNGDEGFYRGQLLVNPE
jgi:hypothetical protein